MNVKQIAELCQKLVSGGVVRGDYPMDISYYEHLVMTARDYFIFEKKKGISPLFLNVEVTSSVNDIDIKGGVAMLPQGYNTQGISGAVTLSKSGEVNCDMLIPISGGGQYLVCDSVFAYYVIEKDKITFKNLPKNSSKLRLHSIAGSHVEDEVSNELAYLIVKEVFKLGQASTEKRPDTSADGNSNDEYIANQIRQFINAPDKIV